MRAEKDELMRKFELIQKTGKIPPELADKIGKERLESLQNTGVNSSINPSPMQTIQKSPNSTLIKPKREQKPLPKLIPEES